jgi:hypothetical protein
MAIFNSRRRRILTSVILGCWLSAFFVAAVHACGSNGEMAGPQPVVAASIDDQGHDDGDTHPGCKSFCAENVPVLAKAQGAQDQPVGSALLLPPFAGEPLLPPVAWAPSPPHGRSPPPGIALINIRFVRLAL